jgi:thiosulfate/3-mercaptopyruvate sulfurtransferase
MTTTHTTLIDAAQLQALMREGAPLVVLDASFDLADPDAGERSYREQHLPGAHYVHLERDLSAPKTGTNGRHPLPAREGFAALVGRLGITPETQVVVYDRQGAMYAARAWWMLRWLGHPAVAVLDGGLAAWQAAGGALSAEVPAPRADSAPCLARKGAAKAIDAEILARLLGRHPLIDARAPERFRGEVEPLDAQAGHIPGARNRYFKDNLEQDGRFKSAQQLRAEFMPLLAGAPPAQVVHQCGSGVTACHNLLAMEHAGLVGSALYPGSWSEWSADPRRPIARH